MRSFDRRPIARSARGDRAAEPSPEPDLARPIPVAGLTVGPADAIAERVADALAESALNRLRRLGHGRSEVAPSPKHPVPNRLSRLAQNAGPGSAAVIGRAGGSLDELRSAAIRSRLGRGTRLPDPTRSRMEVAFGTTLGHVRLHDDDVAAELNDSVSAQAFTVGRDIFVGRGVAAAPAGEQVLAHEIAHVLTEPAGVRRLQRWWQPLPDSPLPVHTAAPKSKANMARKVLWDEILKDPRGQVFRFVDDNGKGWESLGEQLPFKPSTWHEAVLVPTKAVATKWYDATANAWGTGRVPDTHRKAWPEERPGNIADLKGFPSIASVPVYVKLKYRKTAASSKTRGQRGPGLRALDRTARVLMKGVASNRDPLERRGAEDRTPHLATAIVDGTLRVGGNTGTRHVTNADADRGDAALREAIDRNHPVPHAGRAKKDMLKLRALQSGDYLAHHSVDPRSRGLKELSTALDGGAEWWNLDQSVGNVEHGEMTVLDDLHQEFLRKPNRGQNVIERDLGGVKLACGACKLAFDAYNKHIGPKIRYSIRVSGTHNGFYDNWTAPAVIRNDKTALAFVKNGLPGNASLNSFGVLHGVPSTQADEHEPDESESEWEEIP